ncbi:MAG TPA: glycoside hydrolase family 15 protein [Gemmatimonadota bacterium]|nr:glycoside hydrolase family 15 protein [Gemmatimonadota bacterium]
MGEARYPPIADYGLIGDCHTAALVSRAGSIDWCCLPRFDSGAYFCRLLDWDKGGYCEIHPVEPYEVDRRYIEDTLVLETTFRTAGGEARLLDCFTMRKGGRAHPRHEILRIVEGLEGGLRFSVRIVPRFDYGSLKPWIRCHDARLFTAIGGDEGLLIDGDIDLRMSGRHVLDGEFEIEPRGRRRLKLQFVRPETIDYEPPVPTDPRTMDQRLEETLGWWRQWVSRIGYDAESRDAVRRSALVLKALTYAPTGAIAAAVTTSLPEWIGGERNWDYRYTWVRDSIFTVRSLGDLGAGAEADAFRRFMERTAAGSVDDLQIVYGLGGERRRWLNEWELGWLEGYRGSRPVRVGNGAASQAQHDTYGYLLDLAWRWAKRGNQPDEDYWRFLRALVDTAVRRWREPDHGIWEVRSRPRHFVHSKVACWEAVDHGLRLADRYGFDAPRETWSGACEEIRRTIEEQGYDAERGVFVQAFGATALDAALLLIPRTGFVAWEDPRIVRTAEAIRDELCEDGFVLRYRDPDGIPGPEGSFLPCSFWLAECLARGGRREAALEVFERTSATANDLGLYSEEYDPTAGEMLGNFPQGLTHLSHISAAIALWWE